MISFCRRLLAALLVVALVSPTISESKAIPAKRATVTYDYDAFGNLIHSTGTTPNNYLYSGEQFDPDLNLYYNRARYLNVSTGRFWTLDSFEGDSNSPLSLHKYLYSGTDPVDRRDPSGKDFLDSLGALAVSIGTLANQAILATGTILGTVYINLYRVPQIIETANNYLTIGIGAIETLRFLGSNALRYAESYSSIPTQRGLQYEDATQANLGRFFPGIDHFDRDTGVAVQQRSTTQTQSMDSLLAVVNKGVNRLNNLPDVLTGPDRQGNTVTILREDIKERALLVGIPAKPVSWNFGLFLEKVREISQSENITIAIQAVENLEGETLEK